MQDLAGLNWRELPMYREECLIARDPLDLAIELLLLQQTLPVNEFNGWLTESDRKILLGAGLLAFDETGMVGARASLFPVGDCLVFSDPAWPELTHPDYFSVPFERVMFVGQDSRYLACCTTRRHVRKTLDLCTGSGIQALLAAAHSDQVLAVDINPRAVRCAQFNAQTSGVNNLQAILGDLFEPAGEEHFDLIIANPPFVPSPMNTLGFREGGPSGEEIQKRIVEGLPRHLAQGGIAQMITELGERKGESPVQRLREWLGDAPIDIHVLCLRYHTVHDYAIGHASGLSYDDFLDSVHLWLANLRTQGYQRIMSMVISFQWSDPVSSKPWERVEHSAPPVQYAGEEIEAAFLSERLSRLTDLNEKLMCSWVRLAGPLALLDAKALGTNIPSAFKVTPLGRALTMEYQLDPIQREILLQTGDRQSVLQLLTILGRLEISEDSVLAAIASLLQNRLLYIE
jgi:hypothetical protein